MALLPVFDDFYYLNRPSRILDQHFGLTLDPEDLFEPLTSQITKCPAGYLRPWRSGASRDDSGSIVKFDKNKFEANLDVQQFKPEEIKVTVTGDNTVTVEGKHEEKQDEHGYISREFIRRYVLPKNCDVNKVESKLSSDGILSITAPTVKSDAKHRPITIKKTGKPAKQIKNKKEQRRKSKPNL